MTDYLTTLAGPPPDADTAGGFYARVAELTGLPLEVVRRTRGFVAEAYLEHPDGEAPEIASPYDATFALPAPFPESDDGGADAPILVGHLHSIGAPSVRPPPTPLAHAPAITYPPPTGPPSPPRARR